MPGVRLIDANALHAKICEDSENNYGASLNIAQVLLYIETAPTIEQEVRNGEWTIARSYGEYDFWKCGNCKKWNDKPTKYCPRCGAKMKGG
jgi:hypothetical protein